MANRSLSLKHGQSLLETLSTFIVIILLFGGIFKIWLWGNKQIVNRQLSYNRGRIAAGTSNVDYQLVKPGAAEALNDANTFVQIP
ncbi:MAG: hypothetical protein PHN59_05615 [Candidatus Omnitrophica bacterium]|nr:hypothetical protein [Candidatus Omnitrophota bacterium]